MYMQNNHCHQVTAHFQPTILYSDIFRLTVMNEIHVFPSIHEDVTGVVKIDHPDGGKRCSNLETVYETATCHKALIHN